jgi:hypothetical protein
MEFPVGARFKLLKAVASWRLRLRLDSRTWRTRTIKEGEFQNIAARRGFKTTPKFDRTPTH